MRRWQLALALLALTGWTGALVTHLRRLWADEEARARLTTRRNQFLLLSTSR